MFEKLMSRLGYVKKRRVYDAFEQRDKLINSIKRIAKECPSLFKREKMRHIIGQEVKIKGVFKRHGDYGTILIKYPILLPSCEVIADHVWVRGVSDFNEREDTMVHVEGRIYMYNGYKYGIMMREKE